MPSLLGIETIGDGGYISGEDGLEVEIAAAVLPANSGGRRPMPEVGLEVELAGALGPATLEVAA